MFIQCFKLVSLNRMSICVCMCARARVCMCIYIYQWRCDQLCNEDMSISKKQCIEIRISFLVRTIDHYFSVIYLA